MEADAGGAEGGGAERVQQQAAVCSLSHSLSHSLSECVQQQAADQRRGARSWRPLSDVDARRVRPLPLSVCPSLPLSLSRARSPSLSPSRCRSLCRD